MAVVISGNGIDMGNTPVSNASQIDGVVINENGDNVATTSNLVGFKNYIINGNFDIWQRGTSGFLGSSYGADRWISSVGVESYSRQNTDSLGGYYARITRTTASTSSLLLVQRLEQVNVKDLRNKTLTLSLYVRQTVGTTLPINLYIYTPTVVDNYVSVVLQETISILSNPTSTFQKVSVSFTVKNEMVLKGFAIAIGNLSSGIASIDIHQVQLEEGSVATPFENRPYGLELSLCQRYYETIQLNMNTYQLVGHVFGHSAPFRTLKRTSPTISVTYQAYSNATTIDASGTNSNSLNLGATATATATCSFAATFAVSAEL